MGRSYGFLGICFALIFLLLATPACIDLGGGGGGGGGAGLDPLDPGDGDGDGDGDTDLPTESDYGEPFELDITVKESAGVGTDQFPVTAVVPLPAGGYFRDDIFALYDSNGNEIPAQFEALNRWWAQDASLRHLMVKFQVSLAAFNGAGTGTAVFKLRNDGLGIPAPGLTVDEDGTHISVNTGPLQFKVRKSGFNIIDELWLDEDGDGQFGAAEQIINSDSTAGGRFIGHLGGDLELDATFANLTIEVERAGPIEAVIRAEVPATFVSTSDQTHGFAVRIHAFAGQPYLKIDYQLQNSAKVHPSWILYFEEMVLDYLVNLGANPQARFSLDDGSVTQVSASNGITIKQDYHNTVTVVDNSSSQLAAGNKSDGWLDISDDAGRGVMAFTRYFWQVWPNGIHFEPSENRITSELFPNWSAQWEGSSLNTTGLYWLEDMQHVLKETYLVFHGDELSGDDLKNLAKTFNYYPVPSLPLQWYKDTEATFDLDGSIPIDTEISVADERKPRYDGNMGNNGGNYNYNWKNFWAQVYRKKSCNTGGEPYSGLDFIAKGAPRYYWETEQKSLYGELNVRAQWMAQYDFDADWSTLQLTENPYCGGSWRHYNGSVSRPLASGYLANTDWGGWYARDFSHGWFRRNQEYFLYSGNPWVQDWYEFVSEFTRAHTRRDDPFASGQARGRGHGLDFALQAHLVVGDSDAWVDIQDYIHTYLRDEQNAQTGHPGQSGQAFQVSYVARPVITYLEEMRKGGDFQAFADAFNLVAGMVEWNLTRNFCYTCGANANSSGTGFTMCDPQAWLYLNTGNQTYLDHLNMYINTGIQPGVGSTPYGDVRNWTGQYEGRITPVVRQGPKADATPPAAIGDFAASSDGTNVTFTWTAPADADSDRYHIVWGNQQISGTTTTDTSFLNWWKAEAIGPELVPTPGAAETLVVPVNNFSGGTVHAAIYTFDDAQNMSVISNLIQFNP